MIFNDQNFIELVRIKEGVIEKFVDRSQYNLITNELARRTYDESEITLQNLLMYSLEKH